MTRILRSLISLTCALLLCLAPLCASAEAEAGAAMLTVTLENMRGTADGEEFTLPMTVQLSAGADLDALRAFFMLGLDGEETDAAAMVSVEDGEVRAALTGMETGLVMPFEDAAKEFISQFLLGGMAYDTVGEELQQAAADYLRLYVDSLTETGENAVSENPLDAFYPADAWAEEHEAYPALLNAVPAGEEEITLFGQTCTARKYTYSLTRATAEEYDAFMSAYREYYSETDKLDEAYMRLEDLLYEEWEAYESESPSAWADNGSLSEREGGSLSEWDDRETYEVFYSLQGTIWQVDEMMGTLDECILTVHYPDGDATEKSVYSDMHTGSCVRIESSSESLDEAWPDWRSASAESTRIELTETGTLIMDFQSIASDSDTDYSDSFEQKAHVELTDTRLIADAESAAFYSGSYYADTPYAAAPETFALHTDLTFAPYEADDRFGTIEGTIDLNGSTAAGSDADISAGVTVQIAPFPVGELLPAPEKSINPLDADDAEAEAFLEELQTALIRLAGAFMTGPQTSPSVGGALIG